MTDTVTPASDKSEPRPYAATATGLRRIADALDTIQGDAKRPFVSLSILTSQGETTEETIANVDAVALAVLLRLAKTERSGGAWYHRARNSFDDESGVSISIHAEVPGPPDARDAELAKLRAEVAELRAAAAPIAKHYDTSVGFDVDCACGEVFNEASLAEAQAKLEQHIADANADPSGLGYSREADDPTPVSPARRPMQVAPTLGHIAVDGHKLDDDTEPVVQLEPSGLTKAADQSRGPLAGTTPVVTYFSFGHGQKDPDTGQKLIDHYVTVVAPTYEACREAMFASRFGNRWSFDYLAGTARATEWVSRWTEHEVIVASGVRSVDANWALAVALRVLDGDDGPAELKPWESNAPLADRIAESMVPIADGAEPVAADEDGGPFWPGINAVDVDFDEA